MVKVAKKVQDPPGAAAQAGVELHKYAEDYINDGTPFQHNYAPKIISIVDQLKANTGTLYAEKQLAVTRDMKPCGWWDADCHARGVLDVYQVNGDRAIIQDWKTGKSNAFTQQLKHNALLVFINEPEVRVVDYAYNWLKEGFSTRGQVHRDFLQQDWDRFEQRVIKLEKALAENEWPKSPSGLCKNYCPVVECEHNGKHTKT